MHQNTSVHTLSFFLLMLSPAPSPVPHIANIPTVPDDANLEHIKSDTINPTMSSKMRSITYNQEISSYNLEWESRAEFNKWLTYEQATIGIEIKLSKIRHSKNKSLYLTCETFCCVCNRIGGKSHYIKKTIYEQKIENKQIEGGCSCLIQIKIYFHTNTILGKYDYDHFHPTGK